MSSSVQPNDSVSTASAKRKSKPGKKERAAAKSAASSAGVEASASKAALFASGARGDPVPTPGRHPIVFAVGAGEPTRDVKFSLSHKTISELIFDLPGRFSTNPKYAEFRAHLELDDGAFLTQMRVAFLLGLAQQIVHSHVNMDLPLGDFSPLNSNDVRLPGSFRAILSQFGEFSSYDLGTRYMLSDYEATVKKLVFWAGKLWNGEFDALTKRGWLPLSSKDGTTRAYLAMKLGTWLKTKYSLCVTADLEAAVFVGEVPEWWEDIKPLLGEAPIGGARDVRDRFDFLFKTYTSAGQFTTAFSTEAATSALSEIGSVWTRPSAGHMNWDFSTKKEFSDLADAWARTSAAYAKFFEMSSSLGAKMSATGTGAQFAVVSTVDVVTVVRSVWALSAPAYSLVSCFPAACLCNTEMPKNVVVSTPIPVVQRATEFLQQDWRS